MTRRPIQRQHAKRLTRLSQGSAVVLVALGAGAVVAGPRLLEARDEAIPEPVIEPVLEPAESAGDESGDPETIAWQLAMIANAPLPEPEQPPEPEPIAPVEPADATEEAPPGTLDVRYLGAIVEPNRTLAIVTIHGTQHLLRPGVKRERISLISADADRIEIEEEGFGRRFVRKADRSDVITHVSSDAAPAQARPRQSIRAEDYQQERDERLRLLRERQAKQREEQQQREATDRRPNR